MNNSTIADIDTIMREEWVLHTENIAEVKYRKIL